MNHYERLGVPRDATRQQIISTARTRHAELKTANEELKAALAVLADPIARREYDAGLAGAKTQSAHPSMVTKIRYLGVAEGISFLLLLGVAMPLKYFAGIPAAVYWIGSAHGILFVLYLGYLITGKFTVPFPLRLMLLGILSSITPFGPFFLERKLRGYDTV
jgi:integral membrane protein